MGKKLSPYQRIVRAARERKGVHLSAEEVLAMSLDDAISTVAGNDDRGEHGYWTHVEYVRSLERDCKARRKNR